VTPEIRIADYEAGNWIGYLHSSGLDLVIERSGFRRCPRGPDRIGDLFRDIFQREDLAVTPLESLIFGRRHQHEAIMAMMGDGKRRNECLAADAAEGL